MSESKAWGNGAGRSGLVGIVGTAWAVAAVVDAVAVADCVDNTNPDAVRLPDIVAMLVDW